MSGVCLLVRCGLVERFVVLVGSTLVAFIRSHCQASSGETTPVMITTCYGKTSTVPPNSKQYWSPILTQTYEGPILQLGQRTLLNSNVCTPNRKLVMHFSLDDDERRTPSTSSSSGSHDIQSSFHSWTVPVIRVLP
jgi:hypothetical protein